MSTPCQGMARHARTIKHEATEVKCRGTACRDQLYTKSRHPAL
ncbi:MAG: hypothetical protein RBQ99_08845 [Trichlorobacter sp.]|nr:hypothetical protein [Trichlorobacter sp.]